jgi:hypothetical protein
VVELREQFQKQETREIQEGKKRAQMEFELKEKVRQLENWSRRRTMLPYISPAEALKNLSRILIFKNCRFIRMLNSCLDP